MTCRRARVIRYCGSVIGALCVIAVLGPSPASAASPGVVPATRIDTIAGRGGLHSTAGGGDGGPALAAKMDGPSSVAVAADGTVYIADPSSFRVRAVAPDGTMRTVVGTGEACFPDPPYCRNQSSY